MKKTLLEKVEIDKLDSSYKDLFKDNNKLIYLISAKNFTYLDSKGLVVSAYPQKSILSDIYTPLFRVFFVNDTYITEVFYPEGKKWSTSSLTNLYSYLYAATAKIIDKKSESAIIKYFGKKGYKTNNENEVIRLIHTYQYDFIAKRRKSKHQKEINDIDSYMSKFGKLPKNFKKWIDKKGFYDSAYIYYKYVPKKKKLEGYCTWCKKDLLVEGAKHNKKGTCPKCKHPITYKAEGKTKQLYDSKNIEVFELSKDNLLLSRIIDVTKYYKEDYRNPKYTYYEFKRVVYEYGERKHFEMAQFKQNLGVRWCYDSHKYWYYSTLYDDNLDILDNTEFRYSGIKEYCSQMKDVAFTPEKYLETYTKYPFIEHLVKNNLFKFVNELINKYCDVERYLDLSKSSLREILKINKEELRFLKENDIGFHEYSIYMKFKNAGVILNKEELNFFAKASWRVDTFINIMKYGTFKKCYDYLLSAIGKYNDRYVLHTWSDYIGFCEKLNLDLKKKSILYPSNLIKQHDELSEIVIQNRNKRYDKAIEEMYYDLENKYGFTYKNLQIVIPKCAKDVIKEGKSLNHCVGSYIESIVNRKCDIVFIRKSNSLNKSFYTVEVRNGQVAQCKGVNNTDYRKNKEVNEFVELFIKHFSKEENLAKIS